MLVFTYGTLKKGYHNNYLLRDSECKGTTTTPALFNLFDGPYPIAEIKGTTAIQGEVYEVSGEVYKDLCDLEGVDRQWYTPMDIDTDLGKCKIFVQRAGQSNRSQELLITSGVWER